MQGETVMARNYKHTASGYDFIELALPLHINQFCTTKGFNLSILFSYSISINMIAGHSCETEPHSNNWSDRPSLAPWSSQERRLPLLQTRRPSQPSPGLQFVVACLSCSKCLFSQDYIHGEPVAVPITTETRALAINALTTLVYPLHILCMCTCNVHQIWQC